MTSSPEAYESQANLDFQTRPPMIDMSHRAIYKVLLGGMVFWVLLGWVHAQDTRIPAWYSHFGIWRSCLGFWDSCWMSSLHKDATLMFGFRIHAFIILYSNNICYKSYHLPTLKLVDLELSCTDHRLRREGTGHYSTPRVESP